MISAKTKNGTSGAKTIILGERESIMVYIIYTAGEGGLKWALALPFQSDALG